MADKNNDAAAETAPVKAGQQHSNPFENNRSGNDDVKEAQEELENEQTFKEALTERD